MNLINSKKISLILLSGILLFFISVNFGLAQERGLEVDYPDILGEAPVSTKTILPDYVKYIFNFSLMIAGLVAFGCLVYGGFRYLTSAGNPSTMKDARDQIFAAFLGLIVLFSSYLILSTVNPQLLQFPIPEAVKFEPPPISEIIPLERQTLYAQEFPTGKLIDGTGPKTEGGSATSPIYEYEGVLAKTRLERITKLSEEIWATSDEIQKTSKEVQKISEGIKNASEEVKKLTDRCFCGRCSPRGCYGCGACGPCGCQGDPCPDREKIQEQQKILRTLAAQLPPLKTKLESLVPILKQKSKELQKEQEKLEGALNELKKVEKMMKECPLSISENGKPLALLNFDSFWQYKEVLEKQKIVKEINISYPWENISSYDDRAAFYCVETTFEAWQLEETSFSEEELEEFSKIEGIEELKTFCEVKIPIGSAIDSSEDISQRLIDEIQKIADEVPKIEKEVSKITTEIPLEVDNANTMAGLPDQCLCSNCSCWCYACCCCTCTEYGCCCCSCSPSSCSGICCPFNEIKATLGKIQTNHNKITAAYDKITDSHKRMTEYDDEIHNLIAGNEVHDLAKKTTPLPNGKRKPTWAYNIINNELPSVRIKFSQCTNSFTDWVKMINSEKILTKQVVTCREAKMLCWDIEEGYKCHGEGDMESYPNYFCAEAESQ